MTKLMRTNDYLKQLVPNTLKAKHPRYFRSLEFTFRHELLGRIWSCR
jgi:hypothetical protein